MPINKEQKKNPKKDNSKKDSITALNKLPWDMNSMIERDLNNEDAAKKLISVVEEQVRQEEKARRVPILRKFHDEYHKAVKENDSIKPDIHPGYTSDLIARNDGEMIFSREAANKKKNAMSKINTMVDVYKTWLRTGDWNKFESFCKTLK